MRVDHYFTGIIALTRPRNVSATRILPSLPPPSSRANMSAQAASGSQAVGTAEDWTPPTDFSQLWSEVLARYKEKTGKDLPKLLSAEEFPADAGNVDGIVKYIKDRSGKFDEFRGSGQKVLGALKPVVKVVCSFLDVGADVASTFVRTFLLRRTAFLTSLQPVIPGGNAIFTAVGVLLKVNAYRTHVLSNVHQSIGHTRCH